MENSIEQINIEPQEVHFEMVGKQQTKQKAHEARIKDKIKAFAKMAGGAILMIIGGVFLFGMGAGANANGMEAMRGLMYIAGIAAGIFGAVLLIFSFIAPFMPAKEQDNIRGCRKSFLDWYSVIFEKGKTNFHYLERNFPENSIFNYSEINKYISNIRKTIATTLDEITNEVHKTYPQLKSAGTKQDIKIESKEMLFPNVIEICATVTIEDILEEVIDEIEKKSKFYTSAIIKLHIKQYIIKEEKFCYPYNITPILKERQTID